MKVIGAGYGRTGTKSLQTALQLIGFAPCYHMHEVFNNPQHVPYWLDAYRGEPTDWEEFLGAYQAIVDEPGALFYRELMETYHDAKVVLTVRDFEDWYRSCMNTIYPASARGAGSEWATSDDPVAILINTLIWDGECDGRFEDREFARRLFDRHNDEVRQSVPTDRLLVYEVTEGWVPLCLFLEVPVPKEPFPRLNSTEEWQKHGEENKMS